MPLIFLLVFLFSIAIAPAAFAADGDFGNTSDEGIGTAENPYLIDDEADLIAFRKIVNDRNNTGAHAKLTQDITLEDDWTPIGSSDTQRYTGTFDGNGYTIKELSITTNKTYSGLFGTIGSGGKVMNLKLEDVDISFSSSFDFIYAGAVAGYSYGAGATIKGCIVTGNISVECQVAPYVGGIAGVIGDSSTIENCINYASVSGGKSTFVDNVGGIAGEASEGCSLTNCGYLVNSGVGKAVGSGSPTTVNVGTLSDTDELNNIVLELTPLIDGEEFDENKTYSMAAYDTMTISFDAWPENFDYVYDNEYVKIEYPSNNDLVSFDENNGTITVSGRGNSGRVEITVTATLYTYNFASNEYTNSTTSPYEITFDLTVGDVADEEDTGGDNDEEETSGGDNGDDSGSTESGGASGGSSGGGCNAGTGALALLALIPLAMRKKR